MQESTTGRVVESEKVSEATPDGTTAPASGILPIKETKSREAARAPSAGLDTIIILVVAAVIVLVTTGLLVYVVIAQMQTYDRAIASQLEAEKTIDHAAVLAYARSTDFAAAKLAALVLGFLLIFLGAMFVLRVAQVDYILSLASSEKRQFAFSATSPGLAMIALGILLIGVVLLSQSTVDYRPAPTSTKMYLSEDEAD